MPIYCSDVQRTCQLHYVQNQIISLLSSILSIQLIGAQLFGVILAATPLKPHIDYANKSSKYAPNLMTSHQLYCFYSQSILASSVAHFPNSLFPSFYPVPPSLPSFVHIPSDRMKIKVQWAVFSLFQVTIWKWHT